MTLTRPGAGPGRLHHLRFALHATAGDPAVVTRRLVRPISNLPVTARPQWERATTREFDFGFQSGVGETADCTVPAGIVEQIARLNGQIRITIYPAERDPEV